MLRRYIFIVVGLAFAIAGCSSTSKLAKYEYQYEIVDTHAKCEPDLTTFRELVALSNGLISDKQQADSVAKKLPSWSYALKASFRVIFRNAALMDGNSSLLNL